MEPETSKQGHSLSHKNKAIKKRFNFWIKQGKSVQEAEELSMTPLGQLKNPEVKVLLNSKKKINIPHVIKPTNTNVKSTQELPKKSFKHQPCSAPGPIRVGLRAERLIGPDDAPLVMKEVGRLIDICPSDVSPRFVRSSLKAGLILMTCVDRETRDWLESQVTLLKPWPGAKLRLVEDTEIPKRRVGVAWIIDEDLDPNTILSRLHKQNRHLDCRYWKVINVKKQKKGQTVTFSFDETSFNVLRQNNFQVFLTTELINIRVKNYKPDVEQATVSKNSTETQNSYKFLNFKSEQKHPQKSNNRSLTVNNEDSLMEETFGGPCGASQGYSTINQYEEEAELTDWSSASSLMSAENKDYWQHDSPDDPSEARGSEFINDQAERWPSAQAELNIQATNWHTQRETDNFPQYGSVSPRDSYRSNYLGSHDERYTGLSKAEHQRSSIASEIEPEHSTSGYTQNNWQYSSGILQHSHSRSREEYEDWTKSSGSHSREMKKDSSSHDIVWEPKSAFVSSTQRPSSFNRPVQYEFKDSVIGDSRGTKRPYPTTGRGYSRGNSSKRGKPSYTPSQRR